MVDTADLWGKDGNWKRLGAGEQGALRREKELKKVSWLHQGHSIRKQGIKVLFPALLPPFPVFLNSSPEN